MIPRCAILITALLIGGAATGAAAQSSWEARLDINPYPSPYLSDWESNPTIGTLTITNPTAADQDVVLVYRVIDQGGRAVASGRSDPQLIPAGPSTVLTDFVDISGASEHDQGLEDQMRRTGRLPEGDHTACVAVTDQGGFVLAEDCVTFTIVYPDPPYLIGPLDDGTLPSGNPVFQWTPSQVPPAFQLTYVVRVSEVLANQAPAQALVANIPVFETTTFGTNVEYPINAPPLEEGKTYVWRVQALDQNGYAPSANEGRSEVWTFRFDPAAGATPAEKPVTFTLFNAYDRTTRGANANAPSGYPPVQYAFNDICDQWTAPPPEGLVLDVNVPFGFRGFRADHASLYRETDATSRNASRQWWLHAQLAAGPAVLLHGDCSNRILGGLQWIAARTPGLEANLSEFVGSARQGMGAFQSLDFAVWVVALRGGDVEAPEGFPAGRAFLEERDFEVQRGLNAYAVLDLRDGLLRPMWQALGYEENEITLQGFVGLDVERSVGAGMGEHFEASVSQQRSFLKLSAALPERVPFGPLARIASSMQLSFEFEIEDSTGVNVTSAGSSTERSLDFVFRAKHTINLRHDLFRRDTGETRALVGWIGADVAGETEQRTKDVAQRGIQRLNRGARWLSRGHVDGSGPVGQFFGATGVACAPKPDREWHTDFVINYGLEGQIFFGDHFFLEDPALEVHIGPRAANGERDMSFAVVTSFGLNGFDQKGIFGLSRVREGPDGPEPDPACQRMRPRSTTIDGFGRPRADARADPQAQPPATSGGNTLPPATPAQPLRNPWRWEWKIAWDVMPVGALGKGVNGALTGLFVLLGLGGS